VTTPLFNPRRMGAIPLEGATSFRVWAPHATSVAVVGEFNDWNPEAHPLNREDAGVWAREVPGAKPGQQYQFEIVNGDQRLRKNDAYAREIHPEKATSVIYQDNFKWTSPGLTLPHWNEMVLYELHVGTFAEGAHGSPGRFDHIVRRLPYLKNLGVNVLELMPPMSFPSDRSWGYSVTNPFAVEASYGGPDGLKRLVDAAHAQGIGVIIDIVCNHFGPDNLDLWQYDGWNENGKGGIYFYNDERSWTPWGENRPDYGRGEVRQYLRDNVLLWMEEFHVDGMRHDATLFIRNWRGVNNMPEADLPDGWSLLRWINEERRRLFPGRIAIAEDIQQNHWITKPLEADGLGYDSQWDPAFYHPIRQAVVGIDDAHRSMAEVAKAIEFRYNEDAIQRVIYSESHDSVANGQSRIPQEIDPNDAAGYFARKRSTLAAGLTLTTPGIPMLFEGQEFLQDGSFQDDQALDWSKLQTFRGINRLYRDLIHLRRNLFGNTKGLTGPFVKVHHLNDQDKIIAFHRWSEGGPKDDVIVVASFTNRSLEDGYRIGFPRAGRWVIRFNSDWKGYSPDFNDVGNPEGQVIAEKEERDGCEYAGTVALPAYGLLVFSQEEEEPAEAPHDQGGSP
jgi:1,4-alpha-glucan branching enzyme